MNDACAVDDDDDDWLLRTPCTRCIKLLWWCYARAHVAHAVIIDDDR